MNKDFAFSRTKTITRKQLILSFLDGFIGVLLLLLFLAVTGGVMWLIFGR